LKYALIVAAVVSQVEII